MRKSIQIWKDYLGNLDNVTFKRMVSVDEKSYNSFICSPLLVSLKKNNFSSHYLGITNLSSSLIALLQSHERGILSLLSIINGSLSSIYNKLSFKTIITSITNES